MNEKKAIDYLSRTDPIDKNRARIAIKELYSYCYSKARRDELPNPDPKVIFINGPSEVDIMHPDLILEPVCLSSYNDIATFKDKRYTSGNDRVESVIVKEFYKPLAGRDRYHSCLLIPTWGSVNDPKYKWDSLAHKVWEQVYAIYTFKDVCFAVERPAVINRNERGLHCTDGPAVVFKDGTEIYAYEGIKVKKKHIFKPESITLEEIHQKSRYKHIMIALCGVDRYLEMCKNWKPDVKGKLNKFFSFAKMLPYGEEKGYGHLYEKDPSFVEISSKSVNGKYGLFFQDNWKAMYHFPTGKHVFDYQYHSSIFNKEDRQLWDTLNVEETLSRGRGSNKIRIEFHNKVFKLIGGSQYEDEGYKNNFHHDIAPAWFKAKMFLKEDAIYETDKYAIKFENDELKHTGNIHLAGSGIPRNEDNSEIIKCRQPLFRGNFHLPYYNFDINLTSDTWEGLLEKWARFSFDWIGMHENSVNFT